MSRFNLHIENSFCRLSGNIPAKINEALTQALTYRNDIDAEKAQLFGKLKYFRRMNNKKKYNDVLFLIKKLEASEWVCWFKDGTFPTGHKNIVIDILDALKANYKIVDERKKPNPYLKLTWMNTPFDPRYYQKEVIDLCLNAGRGVVESAVGTGKSLMMTYIIKELAVTTLIVVPSRGLLEQMSRDLKTWFGEDKVQTVDSALIRKGIPLKDIRVITIQSMAALQKSGDLQMLVSDIDAAFFDEFHHAGSASYTNLLPEIDHIYYRYGFTGTFLRNDSKILDLWGFLSNKLYSYPAFQAIQEGYLTPLKVITHEMAGKKGGRGKGSSYQKEYDANYCGNPEILQEVLDICTEYPNEQILILVNKKDKAGKIFHEYLTLAGVNNSYISGDDTKEVITDTITAFNKKDINVLIGSSVIGEGIDVRSTDHLVLCQGGKSEISIVQATGRGVRLYEGKKIACVHDFKFTNTKFMEKHYEQRLNILMRNFEPVFEGGGV